MKRLTKTFSVLLILFAMLAFTACKDNDYSVYIFTSTGGTVSIDDSNEKIELKEILRYKKKGSLTLHAHENEGYSFLYWEVNSYFYSIEPTLELTFSGETVIKANFKNNLEGEYTIVFFNDNNELLSEYTIKYNDYITLPTVTVPDGYKAVFVDTEDETNILTSNSKFSYGKNKTFKLKYIAIEEEVETFTVTAQSTANCVFNLVSGSSWTVQKGGSVQFTISIASGYNLTSVKAGTNAITPDNNGVYTISNITSNLVVSATITEQTSPSPTPSTITITPIEGEGYSFELVNGYSWTVAYNGIIKFKVIVDEGYTLNAVIKSDYSPIFSLDGEYYLYYITESFSISAIVTKNPPTYDVTISDNANSDFYEVVLEDGYSFENIAENGEVKFSINVSSGYELIDVNIGGDELIAQNGVYTISEINADIELTINVRQIQNQYSVQFIHTSNKATITDANGDAFTTNPVKFDSANQTLSFKVETASADDFVVVSLDGNKIQPTSGTQLYTIEVNSQHSVTIQYYRALYINYGTISGHDFENFVDDHDTYLYINHDQENVIVPKSNVSLETWISSTNNLIADYEIISINGIDITQSNFIESLYSTLKTAEEIDIVWGAEN